jgi:hypothetical protein
MQLSLSLGCVITTISCARERERNEGAYHWLERNSRSELSSARALACCAFSI